MTRVGMDKDIIISKAVELVNKVGIEHITLKMLADNLGVKSPSLYNHINGLDDLKEQLMIYGWKQTEQRILHTVIGMSGYDAIRAMCYAFYDYATENPGVLMLCCGTINFKVMKWKWQHLNCFLLFLRLQNL